MHHLEQFLIEQDLRNGHESHEIIVGYNIQIKEICLAEYHPGIVFCEWEAGCVELLLPGRDFRFVGRHCCWRLGATDGSELCYRIGSFIDDFWNGVPQKMVVESQQCFGDGEYFLVDSRVGFGEAAQGYEFSIEVSIHMLTSLTPRVESIFSPRVSCLTLKLIFPNWAVSYFA